MTESFRQNWRGGGDLPSQFISNYRVGWVCVELYQQGINISYCYRTRE